MSRIFNSKRFVLCVIFFVVGKVTSFAAPGGFTQVAGPSGVLYDQWGIDDRYGVSERLIHSGAAAAGDFDGDGWVDLFVTRLDASDILFRNLGGETAPGETILFQDVSESAGFSMVANTNGAAWADIDNDGDLDLYVTALESTRFYLYENNGDGTFTENAVARGAALESETEHSGQSVAFGDYDRDGWLDFHTTEWGISRDDPSIENHSVLMRNLGPESPGHFENVTVVAGVEMDTGDTLYGFASNFTDLDNDGWLDLAVTSDYKTAKLFWNNGDGTFHDGTNEAKVNQASSAMGSAIGDFDGNGFLDWYVTSIHDNRLYLNQGDRTFVDKAETLGVDDGSWGWGTSFIDMENDGDKDIVMTNGWFYPTFDAAGNTVYTVDNMKLWRNDSDVMTDVGIEFGITDPGEGKGLLSFDYDRDGDLDLFVANNASTPALYRNDIDSGNDWLQVELEGMSSNKRGIGAKVWLYPTNGDERFLEEVGGKSHFLGQSEALAHFGLGSNSTGVVRLVIEWPSGIRQIVEKVERNQRVKVVEPSESSNEGPRFTAQPLGGTHLRDHKLSMEVDASGYPAPVFQWYRNGEKIPGAIGSRFELEKVKPYHEGDYYVVALNTESSVQSETVTIAVDWEIEGKSIARIWDEVLMDAIRKDFPAPTVHARNLYHVSAAMWDTFWVFDQRGWTEAKASFHQEPPIAFDDEVGRAAAQREAISYAVIRVLEERYSRSINAEDTLYSIRWAMRKLGYDPDELTVDGNSAAAIGNRVGLGVLAATIDDGSNETNDYADTSGYAVSNEPLVFALSGNEMQAPNQWQPLAFEYQITQNGIRLADKVQSFIGANWKAVETFAGVYDRALGGSWDPGAPPLYGTDSHDDFLDAVNEVIRYSATLDPSDDEKIDISPGALHNNMLGTNDGSGYTLNPFTGEEYESNIVSHADYGRILAEFWADGPESETPPGHWNVLYNEISDNPLFERRLGGVGPLIDPLEWDVLTYLTLNGGMHDAAINAWWLKREYDYVRPISMIRYLASLGQRSDPGGLNYNSNGIKLEAGLVEVVTVESSSIGERHEHLSEDVGEITIRSWAGEPDDAESEFGGVEWILAKDWRPYQRATFVTPAFAAYVSGHSTFSRSGAEVLTLLTGSPYFPGGIGESRFEANKYLEFEDGPSETVTLQWATYYDAADQAGLSRLYGGIHVRADDFVGRELGSRIGLESFLKMLTLRWGATEAQMLDSLTMSFPNQSKGGSKLLQIARPGGLEGVPIRWMPSDDTSGVFFYPNGEGDGTVGFSIALDGVEMSGAKVRLENQNEVEGVSFTLSDSAPCLVMLSLNNIEGSAVDRLSLFLKDGDVRTSLQPLEANSLVWASRIRQAGQEGGARSGELYWLTPGLYEVVVGASSIDPQECELEVVLVHAGLDQ